jgi:hypothetical protein
MDMTVKQLSQLLTWGAIIVLCEVSVLLINESEVVTRLALLLAGGGALAKLIGDLVGFRIRKSSSPAIA